MGYTSACDICNVADVEWEDMDKEHICQKHKEFYELNTPKYKKLGGMSIGG